MNEVASYQSQQLPDTLEDLTQFVLVGNAKLQAYKLKLRTVNRLSVAQEIRDQTLKETQELNSALMAAEVRIGELLLAIPSASGRRTDLETSSERVEKVKTKSETVKEMGYSKDEASDYQRMAQNPEVVKRVLEEAIAEGKIATRSQVMKEIAQAKKEAEEENAKLRSALSESETKRIVAENQKAKEIVKEVEVIPEDYAELKDKASRATSYENDFKMMRQEYDKMSEKWKQAEKEKKALLDEMHRPENEKAENIKKSALFFCAGVANFIEKYGGYVWLTDEINDMEKSEREGYVRAINAIDAWVETIKSNLERTIYVE